ncbi:MAG: hypothetical protein VYC65_00970 [Chloroflexota bacterium]|nr:hypothetical protein [Chloroflexota bacterium]|tara:strand:- start:602 stop:910 length:309 start_codon:yes stop_codon:yes gene_type:complete
MDFISTRHDFKHNLKSGPMMLIALSLALSIACDSEGVDESNPGNLVENSSVSEKIRSPEQITSTTLNKAPDFSLPSTQGHKFTRSDFEDKKFVLLAFYRAFW